MVGRHVVRELETGGHDAVVLSRSRGVDLTTGSGLDDALRGVEAVIDVSNTTAMRRRPATDLALGPEGLTAPMRQG